VQPVMLALLRQLQPGARGHTDFRSPRALRIESCGTEPWVEPASQGPSHRLDEVSIPPLRFLPGILQPAAPAPQPPPYFFPFARGFLPQPTVPCLARSNTRCSGEDPPFRWQCRHCRSQARLVSLLRGWDHGGPVPRRFSRSSAAFASLTTGPLPSASPFLRFVKQTCRCGAAQASSAANRSFCRHYRADAKKLEATEHRQYLSAHPTSRRVYPGGKTAGINPAARWVSGEQDLPCTLETDREPQPFCQ